MFLTVSTIGRSQSEGQPSWLPVASVLRGQVECRSRFQFNLNPVARGLWPPMVSCGLPGPPLFPLTSALSRGQVSGRIFDFKSDIQTVVLPVAPRGHPWFTVRPRVYSCRKKNKYIHVVSTIDGHDFCRELDPMPNQSRT